MNKSSWERGFAHGSIYKTELVDLADKVKGVDSIVFGTKPGDPKVSGRLDSDGLPYIGSLLQYGDPFYSYINLNTGQTFITYYKYWSSSHKNCSNLIKVLIHTHTSQKVIGTNVPLSSKMSQLFKT